ncbi:MAG: TatD family hydrolase [Pseudomonadota bacterium]
MFDTHVNLHADAFADDVEDVLARAREAGIRRFVAICDRFDRFGDVYAIAEANDDIWCSVGTHPHHAKDFTDLETKNLVDAAAATKVVAIGETGLDFHYGYSAEADQVRSLKVHIDAARLTGLPIILHTRDADEMMGDILEEEMAKGAFKALLHCYTGGQELAARAAALGAYFSVSGIVSFKNAHDVRDVVGTLPRDKIILETDCPYLAPVPMRGRRNEPAYLTHVCDALAKVLDCDPEALAEETERNALALFDRVPAA